MRRSPLFSRLLPFTLYSGCHVVQPGSLGRNCGALLCRLLAFLVIALMYREIEVAKHKKAGGGGLSDERSKKVLPCTAPLTVAPGRGSPLLHLHQHGARRCHICTGAGLAPTTSAPGLRSPPISMAVGRRATASSAMAHRLATRSGAVRNHRRGDRRTCALHSSAVRYATCGTKVRRAAWHWNLRSRARIIQLPRARAPLAAAAHQWSCARWGWVGCRCSCGAIL